MYAILVVVNGINEIVKVFATSIFSAFNEAERVSGGKAIGGRRGQGLVEFIMIAALLAVVIIAIFTIIVPVLGATVGNIESASSTLEALGQ